MDKKKILSSEESNAQFLETSTNANEEIAANNAPNASGRIQRHESIVSFASNSVSAESNPKDTKLAANEQSIFTSQASNISLDSSSRSSMDQALKSEKAFMEYVMSLPLDPASKDIHQFIKFEPATKPKLKCSSTSTTNTTKVGLDHLDNLCKLMEQLSELRETNTKLQKRVHYLEDLKTLHEMHKKIRREVQYGSDRTFSQKRHLGLKKSLTSTDYSSGSPRVSEDYSACLGRRNDELVLKEQKDSKSIRLSSEQRNRSLIHPPYDGRRRERSKSVGHEEVYDGKSKRIFPKWSKVKEAFGWESERKDPARNSKFYFGTNSGTTLTDQDLTTFRIPMYSDYPEKDEISPIDTYAGEAMAACAEGCMQPFNSSVEDFADLLESYRTNNWKRNSEYSEESLSLLEPPDDDLRRQSSTPFPGSDKMKTYREILEQQPKASTIERDTYPEQAYAKFGREETKKSHKSPWGRVKTIIERRRDSLKSRNLRRGPQPEPILPQQSYREPNIFQDLVHHLQDGTSLYHSPRKSSNDQCLTNLCLPKTENRSIDDSEITPSQKTPSRPLQEKELDGEKLRQPTPPIQLSQIERSDNLDNRLSNIPDRKEKMTRPGFSPQLHRKSTWMKMKNVLRSKKDDGASALSSQSMPSSPNGVHDGTFDFDDTENLEDNNEEMECFESGHEIARIGSDRYVNKLALSTTSPPVADIMMELQRNVSDDFSRKMQEWERIRHSGIRPINTPKWERKNSGSKSRKKPTKMKTERFEKSLKPKIKDLTWLEKELQKIEKEKQRLSKEKEKFEERAVRLERLKQTVLTTRNSNKKEILVKTSAGEFRFEGISDAFTKKLYEWETKRGLGPELSTIALLDSSLGTNSKNSLTIQQLDKCCNLNRGLSRSESSIVEIGQPSHTSSNSLPSLKPSEIGDLERMHQPSRANSEPDLTSFVGKTNNKTTTEHGFANQSDLTTDSSRDTLGMEQRDSYVHPEVTQLIDSDVEDVEMEIRQDQKDETYYSLLEENVILLEQLKNKEEICRRLEKDLELLDEKVDEMNKHHQQEMEKYRKKLWEMHKPDSTPKEIQGCLQVMVELRSRIENLEECSEKLKNEKETLEDSFRFHSAEQEHMTIDLLDKMRELHAAGGGSEQQNEKEKSCNRECQQTNFDLKIVERLQDLSSQLVKQTRELEQALAERTRQICQLRWELLHRDVSTVKLETELHSAHMQGTNPQNKSACDVKRSKYAHFRSWSSEEASSRSRQECAIQDKERPKASSIQEAYKIPKTEFQPSELSNTVYELNKELIRLSTAAESFLYADGRTNSDEKGQSTQKENAFEIETKEYLKTEEGKSPAVLPTAQMNSEGSQIQPTETRKGKISVRRNSAGSISITSGLEPGGSESSSVCDENSRRISSINVSPKVYQKPSFKTAWTDSESSSEETFTKITLSSPSERSSGPLGEINQEMILKHSNSWRKANQEYDSDESQDVDDGDMKANPSVKRKINYKGLKTARKLYNRTGQCLSEIHEMSQRLSNSEQNESEATTDNRIFKIKRECQNNNRQSNEVVPSISPKQSSCSSSKTIKPTDQVATKLLKQFKSSDNARKQTLHKDFCNSTYKSHSMRAAASDSKIPRCNRVKIKKSESCHEQKTHKNDIYENQQQEKKLNERISSRQSSFSEKNNNVERNRIPKIPNAREITHSGSTEYGMEGRIGVVFTESKESYNIHDKMTSTESSEVDNSQKFISQSQNRNDIQTRSQSSLNPKKISKVQHTTSIKNKTNEKYPIVSADSYYTDNRQNCPILGKKIDSIKTNIQSLVATTSSSGLTDPAEEIQETFDQSIAGEHISNSSEKVFVRSPVERIVIVPQRRLPKSVTEGACSTNKPTDVKEQFAKLNQKHSSPECASHTDIINPPTNCINDEEEKIYQLEMPKSEQCEEQNARPSTENKNDSFTFYSVADTDYAIQHSEKNSIFPSLELRISHNSSNKGTTIHANSPLTQKTNISSSTLKILSEQNTIEDDLHKGIKKKAERKFETDGKNDTLCPLDESLNTTKLTNVHEDPQSNSKYFKSPSAPQLDWKKSCAKKISRQDAPNVKILIEKYNQKIMDIKSPKSPCSSNYNSPAIKRKVSISSEKTEQNEPFSNITCTPKIITTSSVYNPIVFKPTNLDIVCGSSVASPPTSPSSQARAENLMKAKEKFISSSSILTFTPDNLNSEQNKTSFTEKFEHGNSPETINYKTQKSATDSEITKRHEIHGVKPKLAFEKEVNRKSLCSNKSSDSMSIVLQKTGEACQEFRLLKHCNKQKTGMEKEKLQTKSDLKTSRSLSNCSIFKAVTGHEIKFPSSFLKLRRSRKKKDMASMNQQCRQSLLLDSEDSNLASYARAAAKVQRSCPSSPELKSKTKSKTSWFQRGFLGLK